MEMPNSNSPWVTALIVVLGFVYQAWSTARQRRWDLEDRQKLAADLTIKAESLAQTVADTATSLAADVALRASTLAAESAAHASRLDQHVTKLDSAIAENTLISTQAFKEANHVNLKITALGIENNALQSQQILKAQNRPHNTREGDCPDNDLPAAEEGEKS